MSIRRKAWIIAGRILLGFFATLILLALLLKIFCTEENWHGRRALAHCERELRARGEKLDLATFVPPLVPDGRILRWPRCWRHLPKLAGKTLIETLNHPARRSK